MWNAKTKFIPVVVGALGTLRKDFAKGVELIPGLRNVLEIQKSPCWVLPIFYGKFFGSITKRTGSAPDSSFTDWKAERNNVKIP